MKVAILVVAMILATIFLGAVGYAASMALTDVGNTASTLGWLTSILGLPLLWAIIILVIVYLWKETINYINITLNKEEHHG